MVPFDVETKLLGRFHNDNYDEFLAKLGKQDVKCPRKGT